MALIELLEAQLPQTFNLPKKKKMHFLRNIIKQSAIKQGMPVF